MKTMLKLFDGRKVVVEQTATAITASYDGEQVPRRITSQDYMRLVLAGTPVGSIT